jgi:inorganic pyrophosphatase
MSLRNVPFGSLEPFNVVIEIPQGSKNKYEYSPELDVLTLDFVFTGDFAWPFNYGFVPETLAGDGDALDVIVLASNPIDAGSVVSCRAVGLIETLDRDQVDNKLIAVPVRDHGQDEILDSKDLGSNFFEICKTLYAEIARQKKKTVELSRLDNKKAALAMLASSHEFFKTKQH